MPALVRLVLAAAILSSGTSCAGRLAADRGAAESATAAVKWREFAPETLAEAKARDKIVLIDVIARWCHWCHVMEEETYGDPEVVAILNRHFVAIKVDSDARPDIADRYAEWGWPATAVLTSDARPVLELRGYQEPREFAALLRDLVARHEAGKLVGRVDPPAPPPRTDPLSALRAAGEEQLDRYYHEAQGGWGKIQKYPLAGANEYLLLRAHLYGEKAWEERLWLTLGNQRALIDPVWGGVYQYSLRGVWTAPHYEKIAAIQAGAIESYALAYRRTGDAKWQAAAAEVRRYVLSFLQDPEGGFYTSQDADLRPGTGGGEAVVGEDYYALDDAGRRALGIPIVDTNIYADLNGKLIRALCLLYAIVPHGGELDHEALEAARRAAERVIGSHRREGGAFAHGASDRGILHLADQAAMGRALLALYRVTGQSRYLELARGVADFVLGTLQDPAGGFYAHTEEPNAIGVFAERRRPFDENAATARFLVELQRTLDHTDAALPYAAAAEKALRAISHPEIVEAQGRMIGEYLVALAELGATPVDITVVGRPEDPGAQALLSAALAYDEPRAIVAMDPPGARYPDLGRPAVFLCTDSACSAPITEAAKFKAEADAFMRGVPRP
ncbi:MAG TPA: DUF255 domain-containing protein [Nannocystis sp.]